MIFAARKLVAAGALSMLAGCTSAFEGNETSQIFQALQSSWNGSFGNGGVTLKDAAAIPYASMGWRLDGGRENIIVLATDSGHEQLWTSKAHVVLVTQNGLITHTVGLPQDLTFLQPHSETSGFPAQALVGPYSDQRTIDIKDLGVYGVGVSCKGRLVATQSVRILGKLIRTKRVDETCDSPTLKWSFKNSFWLDGETGFAWRSVQSIRPNVVLTTEILRPPG